MKPVFFALLIIFTSTAAFLNAQKSTPFTAADLELYSEWTPVPGMDAVILYNPCPDLTSKASLGPITPPTDKTQGDQKAEDLIPHKWILCSYVIKKSWGRQKVGSTILTVDQPPLSYIDKSYLLRTLVVNLLKKGEIKDLDRPQKNSVTVLGWRWVEQDFFYSTEQEGWLEN